MSFDVDDIQIMPLLMNIYIYKDKIQNYKIYKEQINEE
jgi:hypothetical protein